MQQCDDDSLTQFIRDRVVNAALGQDIDVDEVLPVHLSPPRSRRRATLHAANKGGKPAIGFRAAGSHMIVDMAECHILRPELFACTIALRKLLARRKGRYACDIEMTLVDQGVDISLKNLEMDGLEETEAMLDFARDNDLARLTLDQGYGPETLWEPVPATVTLSGVPVGFPSGSFLQATDDGEGALVTDARAWLAATRNVADLFSGLGTFALALAGETRVLAVEAARDAHLSCKIAAASAGRPVQAVHRDLFRNPLQLEELGKFGGILLDPPRAGARDQIALLAQSSVERIVYISCNPSSWGRDASKLVDGGYRLMKLHPVGQFRWSNHVELASLFVRD